MSTTLGRGAPILAALALGIAGCTGGGGASPSSTTGGGSPGGGSPAASGSDAASPSASASVAASGGQASPTGLTAVYVSNGPIGVNPFLQLIQRGAEQGGRECGVEVRIVESADVTSMQDNLQATVDEGADLIVANFEAVDPITRLASENPDQKWALVDATMESPNVRGIVFKEHEGSYLLGAIFGLLATGEHEGFPQSEVIGAVGAVDLPFIRRWYVGFEEGVEQVNPDVEIQLGWATGFNDPATSKELALAQNDAGAEYIFAFSAAGNTGVFEAARERDFFTSGVDTDQRVLDPEHVIESMVKRTDIGVRDAICDLANGSFSGGPRAYGLAEGSVGPAFLTLEDLDPPSTLPEDVQEQVRDLAEQVTSGEITVTDFLAQ